MNVIIYSRVSLSDGSQTTENQRIELERWEQTMSGRLDFQIVARFADEASSKDTRPGKEQALKLLRTKQADTVVFWSLDRWGRTMRELVLEFEEAVQRGWTLISLREGLSLDTAAGRMYANLLAVFANFERDRISERTRAGLERARAQGKRLGRPVGRRSRRTGRRLGRPRTVKVETAEQIVELRSQGMSYERIGAAVGLGWTTVRRVVEREAA